MSSQFSGEHLSGRQLLRQSKTYRRRVTLIAKYILAFFVLIFALIPVAFIISTAFNPTQGISQQIFPERTSLENFRRLLTEYPFLLWMGNTAKISVITALLSSMITTLTAYAFSRFRFAGRGQLLMGILLIQVFPSLMTMVALFNLLNQLGSCCIPQLGINTHAGLILIYMGGAMGINVWLMKGFFDSIPREIDEAGMIDGASDWQRFWLLVFPLARPIVMVVSILTFFVTYSDWVLPTVMLRQPETFTLMMGIELLVSATYGKSWGLFAAGALLGSILPVGFYMVLQDKIVGGLTAGSVKG